MFFRQLRKIWLFTSCWLIVSGLIASIATIWQLLKVILARVSENKTELFQLEPTYDTSIHADREVLVVTSHSQLVWYYCLFVLVQYIAAWW